MSNIYYSGEIIMKKTKKYLFAIIAATMAISVTACGTTGNSANNNSKCDINTESKDAKKDDVNVSLDEIEKKIIEAVGKDNYLADTEIDTDTLKNSFGLDMSKIESHIAKENSISSINPDITVILKTKDGYADEAVTKLNEKFAVNVSYVRQYDFGTQKVLNARIYKEGDYVIYIIGGKSYDGEDKEEESKLAGSEYEKIDNALKDLFGHKMENKAVVPEDKDDGFDMNDMPGAM